MNKTWREGEEKKVIFGKGVRIEETTPFGLVTDSVMGGLVIPVDGAQFEIVRRVVDDPIVMVVVCITGE